MTTTWGLMPLPPDLGGGNWCGIRADVALDSAFTKGPPLYVHAYMRVMWVGEGGGTAEWGSMDYVKLARGDASVSTYAFFDGMGQGYYVVDRVRVDLVDRKGAVLGTMEVPTMNTCENGPTS